MTYQPKVYRKQGGAEQVVASGGKLNLESGSTMTLAGNASVSGTMAVPSGGAVTVASGGSVTFASGSSLVHAVSTVATSATTITADGFSLVTGTTAGPTFLIANPKVGVMKYIHLTSTSSGATHRAIIAPASTAVSFDTTGANLITLATSALRGVSLIGETTAKYKVIGTHVVDTAGLGNVGT